MIYKQEDLHVVQTFCSSGGRLLIQRNPPMLLWTCGGERLFSIVTNFKHIISLILLSVHRHDYYFPSLNCQSSSSIMVEITPNHHDSNILRIQGALQDGGGRLMCLHLMQSGGPFNSTKVQNMSGLELLPLLVTLLTNK